MNRFPHLAQRVFNVPLALEPTKAEVIVGALADRLGVARLFRPSGDAVVLAPQAFMDDEDNGYGQGAENGYDVVAGIAVIPIAGTLVQKNGYLRPFSGMTGYDGIRANFLTALSDPAVKAIVLDIDSPGGEVAGCFDLADLIYQSRSEKLIWAILNECAYSAAYALASAADKICVPRTGGTGSIGVVCMHVDWSKALGGAGIAVTYIQYGARKTDGAPEKPLSKDARERFQTDIDKMGELFVDTVARNRRLPAANVRATEAAIYLGGTGVDIGLADAVMAPDAAFRALLTQVR